MSNKPLNISEEARVQMPMKTVASLIAMVAIGTWAYFGIIETQNKLSTQVSIYLLLTLRIQSLIYLTLIIQRSRTSISALTLLLLMMAILQHNLTIGAYGIYLLSQ